MKHTFYILIISLGVAFSAYFFSQSFIAGEELKENSTALTELQTAYYSQSEAIRYAAASNSNLALDRAKIETLKTKGWLLIACNISYALTAFLILFLCFFVTHCSSCKRKQS